ncbi:MAG TPA: hypothetical protein VGR65_07790 [Casimicrobiaceae bacterium]|nr:hypothetical protein [Casimicrobiaceae bacterium]
MRIAAVGDAARADAALIERFYSAFARREVEMMLSCYRPDDPPVRSSVRARAAKGLAAYMAANP